MMNIPCNSTAVSRRIRRAFLFVLLVQLSHDWTTRTATIVDASYFNYQQTLVIPSCKDHGISSGPLMEEQCVAHCYPLEMEAFDYVDSEEDPEYLIRNTVCRCYADSESASTPRRKISECHTRSQVWDKRKPPMSCLGTYGINSLATCQEYCKRVDPKAFSYKGSEGDSTCECAERLICDDEISSATIASSLVSISLTLWAGCLLML
ncbi:unnamed protein product [Pseudo-nitzschia multistriata]|uniref:Apple domain-containing protein n=1 Tax=Pseudo-nitzschia multistriata TaxID=183589 RepID=A0A448ZH62_9STRA|nr:unnamed protein product [Pseudo-nitzschia multistriata]